MASYHVENFGCRATQADGAALERQFQQLGLSRRSAAEADFVILNTCTVTSSADQDARAAIRRVKRQNPNAKIVVTGCYAQRAPEEVAALPGVSCVVGNSHKHQLAELALGEQFQSESDVRARGGDFVPLTSLDARAHGREPEAGSRLYVSDIFAHTEFLAAPVFDLLSNGLNNEWATDAPGQQRTRPNLKVQDGCDNRCSFCVIPSVRGQSRSLPLEQVLREVNMLVKAGYRELVISGINLGRWGRDLDAGFRLSVSGFRQFTFEDLIRAILEQTSLEKLRISSVEPMDWSDELICLVAYSPRIAKHAHVPLQSGSDAVLRRMHRKYRPWHYREKIEKIRAAMPSAAIGADVMVGFPGETEEEFEATRSFIEDLPFTYLHVFTYSTRPGTPAAAMREQVPVHIARSRNRVLRELAESKKRGFMKSFIGQTLEAITLGTLEDPCEEMQGKQGTTEALTDNFLKLRLKDPYEPNQRIRVEISAVDGDLLTGYCVPASLSTTVFRSSVAMIR